MTIGQKILKLRKARAWNQEELAERIGVTRQAVSRWESDSAKPDADKLIALCDLFGVSADYLLREQYMGEVAASSPPVAQNGPREKNTRLFTAKQVLGFSLFALGILLLFAAELVGILQPHTLYTDHGIYHGFQAYVQVYNLHWMVWLLWSMIGVGLLLMLLDPLRPLLNKIHTRKEKK